MSDEKAKREAGAVLFEALRDPSAKQAALDNEIVGPALRDLDPKHFEALSQAFSSAFGHSSCDPRMHFPD